MADTNLQVKDATGTTVYLAMNGAGSNGDPNIPKHNVASIVAGASADIGAVTDAAVVGDNNGSLLGKLRGLTKIANDVWDSTNHRTNISLFGKGTAAGDTAVPSLDTVGHAGFVKLTDGTNTAPTMDAVARPGFFKLTDGTNTAPTMDAVGRAGFVKLTDGTNTHPTMDAVARPGFVKLTDGTNTAPTMDAVARPGFFKLTDGTNTAPTMDAAARAGFVKMTDGTLTFPVAASADGLTTANLPISVNSLFNGTTSDKERGNTDVSVLTSSARTTTQTSADQTNHNSRGLHVVLDMTTVGTGSVTVTINAKDVVSGKYYLLLSGAAITTNSTNVYKVFPGAPVTTNVSANDTLPRTFQIVVTANNANAATYTVGYCLMR